MRALHQVICIILLNPKPHFFTLNHRPAYAYHSSAGEIFFLSYYNSLSRILFKLIANKTATFVLAIFFPLGEIGVVRLQVQVRTGIISPVSVNILAWGSSSID